MLIMDQSWDLCAKSARLKVIWYYRQLMETRDTTSRAIILTEINQLKLQLAAGGEYEFN